MSAELADSGDGFVDPLNAAAKLGREMAEKAVKIGHEMAMTYTDQFARAAIGADPWPSAEDGDEWTPTASAVGELDLPAEWQQAPWAAPKPVPSREHWVQVQMVCGGCESRMGLFMTLENTPDAMIITCRCGFINAWRPR